MELRDLVLQGILGLVVVGGSSFWILGLGKHTLDANVLKTDIQIVRSQTEEALRLIDRARTDQLTRERLMTEVDILIEKVEDVGERVRTARFERELAFKTQLALGLVSRAQSQFTQLSLAGEDQELLTEKRVVLNHVFSELIALERTL